MSSSTPETPGRGHKTVSNHAWSMMHPPFFSKMSVDSIESGQFSMLKENVGSTLDIEMHLSVKCIYVISSK